MGEKKDMRVVVLTWNDGIEEGRNLGKWIVLKVRDWAFEAGSNGDW